MEHLAITASRSIATCAGLRECGVCGCHRALPSAGVKIIGISDHTATYFDRNGLDISALERHVLRHRVLIAGANSQVGTDLAIALAGRHAQVLWSRATSPCRGAYRDWRMNRSL